MLSSTEGAAVESTWESRDLPVLDAIVRLLDQGSFSVSVRDVVTETGLDTTTVDRAITALEGPFVVEYEQFATGGDPNPWSVRQVTAAARQAVGQWPTPESLTARVAQGFSDAADREPDAERKTKLRQVADFLGNTGKDVAAEVLAKVILRPTGMG
jgi:hypothetical protein